MSADLVAIRMELQGVRQTLAELRNSQQEIKRQASASATASERIAQADDKATDSVERGARRRKRAYQETGHAARKAAQEMEEAAGRAARASRQMERDQYRAHMYARTGYSKYAPGTATGGGGLGAGLGGTFVGGLAGGIAAYGAAEAGSAVWRGGQAALAANDRGRSLERMIDFRYGGGGEEFRRSLLNLAQELGAPVGDLMQSVRLLSGVVGRDDLISTIRSFFALAPGASPTDVSAALLQYSQVGMNGRLQGDELRIMLERGVDMRGLLNDSGLGSRVGSQTEPITFQEIQKAMLEYGKSSEAANALAVSASTATAALNRLSNVIEDRVLATIGRRIEGPVANAANNLAAGGDLAAAYFDRPWYEYAHPLWAVGAAFNEVASDPRMAAQRTAAHLSSALPAHLRKQGQIRQSNVSPRYGDLGYQAAESAAVARDFGGE